MRSCREASVPAHATTNAARPSGHIGICQGVPRIVSSKRSLTAEHFEGIYPACFSITYSHQVARRACTSVCARLSNPATPLHVRSSLHSYCEQGRHSVRARSGWRHCGAAVRGFGQRQGAEIRFQALARYECFRGNLYRMLSELVDQFVAKKSTLRVSVHGCARQDRALPVRLYPSHLHAYFLLRDWRRPRPRSGGKSQGTILQYLLSQRVLLAASADDSVSLRGPRPPSSLPMRRWFRVGFRISCACTCSAALKRLTTRGCVRLRWLAGGTSFLAQAHSPASMTIAAFASDGVEPEVTSRRMVGGCLLA